MSDQFDLISKYRTPLMGIAIISVLWVHLIGVFPGKYFKGFASFVYEIPNFVYTDGFLLLSGFGLFFCYRRCSSLKEFYLRRLFRLYLPFITIATPFLLYLTISEFGFDIIRFIGRITTIGFWIEGNYYGMWYVAVSIVLYAIYPILHNYCFSKGDYLWKVMSIWALWIVLIWVIKHYYNDYYWSIFFVEQTPCFLVGMLLAYFSCEKNENFVLFFPFMFLGYIAIDFLNCRGWGLEFITTSIKRIGYLFAFVNLIEYCSGKYTFPILNWLGRHTLEIYMLHLLIYGVFCTFVNDGNVIHSCMSMILAIFISITLCSPIQKFVKAVITKMFKK